MDIRLARIIVVGFGILVLVMVGISIYNSVSIAGKVEVRVLVAPKDSTVRIDGKQESSRNIYLTPGKHQYVIAKTGFRTEIATVDVINDGRKNKIVGMLDPVSNEAFKIYNSLKNEYTEVEGAAGEIENVNGQLFTDINPITSLLPRTNMLFTIGYRADPKDPTGNSIILEINAPPVYRDAAITQITDWGYNPVDFKINFKDEQNPFAL